MTILWLAAGESFIPPALLLPAMLGRKMENKYHWNGSNTLDLHGSQGWYKSSI